MFIVDILNCLNVVVQIFVTELKLLNAVKTVQYKCVFAVLIRRLCIFAEQLLDRRD